MCTPDDGSRAWRQARNVAELQDFCQQSSNLDYVKVFRCSPTGGYVYPNMPVVNRHRFFGVTYYASRAKIGRTRDVPKENSDFLDISQNSVRKLQQLNNVQDTLHHDLLWPVSRERDG